MIFFVGSLLGMNKVMVSVAIEQEYFMERFQCIDVDEIIICRCYR